MVGDKEVELGKKTPEVNEQIILNKPGFKFTIPRIHCHEESDAGEEVELQVDLNLKLTYGANQDHKLPAAKTIRTDIQEHMSVHSVWSHTFCVPSEFLDDAAINISLANALEIDDTSPNDPLSVTNNPDSKYNGDIKGLGRRAKYEGSYDIKGDGNSMTLFFEVEKIMPIETIDI